MTAENNKFFFVFFFLVWQPRLDDSTSDDSSQTLQTNTITSITTQLSQANHVYTANELNIPISNTSSLRRLHSYPSGSDTDTSPPQQKTRSSVGKPPVPERNAELLTKVGHKRVPPPPPPRTSSRSPLASPTSPNVSQRMPSVCENDQNNGDGGNSSGNESSNSQDHSQRQHALEARHQELLKKQKQLQEQYARLQQISKTGSLPSSNDLKKTGSESNLPQKMGLNMAVSGSMKNLNVDVTITEAQKNEKNHQDSNYATGHQHSTFTTTKQVYETDIL